MNKGKVVLLGVAILAVGLMVMPYAISSTWYTGGTHDWSYDGLNVAGDDTNWTTAWCSKCHGSTTGADTSATARYHAAQICSDCHDPQWTGDAGGATGGNHTAITIPTCTQAGCHDWVPAEFSATEPHLEMYNEANGAGPDASETGDVFGNPGTANEACIACHTGVTVSVTFTWSDPAQQIDIAATGGPSGWTVVDFS